MAPRRTIVAMGGVEWTASPADAAIHDYIVALAGEERPRVCHLPTASGDPAEQIAAFHSVMSSRGVEASVISIFRLGARDIDLREHLLGQDVIYVGGGSMVNLMALWREHGIDAIMREAYASGVILCGYSAGSMCWFEEGISRGTGSPGACRGIGLLEGSHCVHYRQDPGRRATYMRLVASGAVSGGIALDDHCAAHFEGGQLIEVVRSRQTAAGYRVSGDPADGARERKLGARTLAPERRRTEPAVEELRELRRRGRA